MTERERQYSKAKSLLHSRLVEPVVGFAEATSALMEEYRQRANDAKEALEGMRPVWAQGWSTDSIAAQTSATALAELWGLLEVDNQTDAVTRLTAVLGRRPADLRD